MASPFTPKTLAFLRALKRNNDREWFREHRAAYERDVRGPMLDVIERLAGDFARVAPELVAEPRVSLYRIYRDTRFSADKSPLKTHAAAHFPSRALPKGRSAGLYFEVSPAGVWIGGGLYMPASADLRLIREHIAANHGRLRRAVTSAAFIDAVGGLEGARLTRVPRGYPTNHKAADYLRFKQFLAGCEHPAAFATSPLFYPDLLRVYRAILPMVRFLNDALASVAPAPPQRVF